MNGEPIWESGGGNLTNKLLIKEGFEIIGKYNPQIVELLQTLNEKLTLSKD